MQCGLLKSIFLHCAHKLRRVASKQLDGLEPSFVATLEAEAPLSLTVYGREKRRNAAVFFRTDSDCKTDKWVKLIHAAVRTADANAFSLKKAAAERIVPDIVAAIAAHAISFVFVIARSTNSRLCRRVGVSPVLEPFLVRNL